jgi:hypothetical protein
MLGLIECWKNSSCGFDYTFIRALSLHNHVFLPISRWNTLQREILGNNTMPAITVIPPVLVDAQPAIVPEGLAGTTIIVSAFLGGLSILLVSTRLAVRGWFLRHGTKAYGLDDAFLLVALAPFLSACGTAIQACY